MRTNTYRMVGIYKQQFLCRLRYVHYSNIVAEADHAVLRCLQESLITGIVYLRKTALLLKL